MAGSSSTCRSLLSSCVRSRRPTAFRRPPTAKLSLTPHSLLSTHSAPTLCDPSSAVSGHNFVLAAPRLPSGARRGTLMFTPRSIAVQNFSTKPTDKTESGEGREEDPAMSESELKLIDDHALLKEQHEDLMDKYRRSIAESDNMRKRLTKQIEDAKVFGIQSFCKDLLEVGDVLSKASSDITDEIVAKESSSYLKDVVEGVRLTEAQLQQVFRRHGLVKMEPLGEKFDPNQHEALFQVPAPDKEPNTVVDVQTVGYLLNGRTIRPAKVGVSRK